MNSYTVTSKDFSYSVKFLKKNGYTFDARSKTWTGDKDVSFLVDGGYIKLVATQTVRLVNEDSVTNVER
jgi:hypothetical protein